MQIKSTLDRIDNIKDTTANVSEDAGIKEPSYTAGGNSS
jgi:hypothetical protein